MVPRALALVLVLLVAGCASQKPVADDVEEVPTGVLSGVVVSATIVPIEGATVSLPDEELEVLTDEKGKFEIGPLVPGTYRLEIRAKGYDASLVSVPVSAGDNELVKVVLTPNSPDVPYHDTITFQGYLECTFDSWVAPYQILGAPCVGLVDLVTGTTVSWDKWQFVWTVDSPGLAGILIEMVWDPQPTGDGMGLLLRNVAGAGSGVDAGGTNIDTQYFSTRSNSPMRAWVHQGIENPGADSGAVFQEDQNETMDYKILILGRADYDQQADVHLMLQNEPELFLTRFFHAMGGQEFTVLGE